MSLERGEKKIDNPDMDIHVEGKLWEMTKEIRDILDKMFEDGYRDEAPHRKLGDTGWSNKDPRTIWQEMFADDDPENNAGSVDSSDVSEAKEDVDSNNKDEAKEDVESSDETEKKKELTAEEINAKQIEAIKDAFNRIAKGEKLTDAEKGNLGEMLMDQYYIRRGYTPIHKNRVTSLDDKTKKGIDGAYEKEGINGKKSFVIADAKVNSSKLNVLADGTTQMSQDWVDERLDDAVGKEKADEIRDSYDDDPGSVSKEVYHYDYGDSDDGTSRADISTVDEDGNKSEGTVVQVFDSEGNVAQEFDNDGNEISGGVSDDKG